MQMWKKETFPEISINCYDNPPATLCLSKIVFTGWKQGK